MECSAQVIREAVPLDPIGYLLHKVTVPRPEDIAALPNKKKQTQNKTSKKKNHLNKTKTKNLNKMKTHNQPDAEFKTLVIRMFNELSGRVDKLSENFNKEIGNIKTEIDTIKKEPARNKEHNN